MSKGTGRKPDIPLRRGWTTGACATAATKAALTALLTGAFPDPVKIRLPKGEEPAFPLALEESDGETARAGIIKDAGDDPDVTHGATVIASVRLGGESLRFVAGHGVGTVTKPGLPVAVGEPAVNPVPRRMMIEVFETLCAGHGVPASGEITLSIPDGEALAEKTWNPRLGIVGGLSILGTTGVVHPYSCAAWIHSIHRGVDVARAAGHDTIIASTGSTSETTAAGLYDVPPTAFIDMGDFAGGLLKYLRAHPVPRLVLAGGFAKLTKLGQGALDLHSGRSQVTMDALAELALSAGADAELARRIAGANTANEAMEAARARGVRLGDAVARDARRVAIETLRGAPVTIKTLVVDRAGGVVGRDE